MKSHNCNHSIEYNIKRIAIVGVILLLGFAATLIVVQNRLADSQDRLTETIVPIQRKLGELTATVGALFLRQSEIVSADANDIAQFSNRDRQEAAVRDNHVALTVLLSKPSVVRHPSFPAETVDNIQRNVDEFLKADAQLYQVAARQLEIQSQFKLAVANLDNDLKKLMIDSAGAAGILRLEYMAALRNIHRQLDKTELNQQNLRSVVVGDSRSQLDIISELDSAVLQLGVLAGKVGLATSQDAMNSLVANELNQNRRLIKNALQKLEVFTSGSKIADRISNMRAVANEMADRVGNEVRKDSLASIRREMLKQNTHLHEIQAAAASTATNLNAQISTLRGFNEALVADANASAASTIWGSRLATAIVSLAGLTLTITSGLRVRTSVRQLRSQNEALENLSQQLASANTTLEATVAERTASLQMILDNTGEGVLSVDLDGKLLPERSAVVTRWCGRAAPHATLWEYLGADDPQFANKLEIAFMQIAEQIFPFEVAAAQAPAQFQLHGRTFALGFREVQEGGQTRKVLVIIRDITQQLEAERVERESRELHKLIGNLLKDRPGFQQHLAECANLIASLEDNTDTIAVKRILHTIKGTTAILGFQRISDWTHELESCLAEEERLPTAQEYQSLLALWKQSLMTISDYLTVERTETIELYPHHFEQLRSLVSQHDIADEINQLIEYWNYDPIVMHFNRLSKYSKQIAQRLSKDLRVSIDDESVRTPRNCLNTFWASLIHVVRNSIDHGIESPADRLTAGKPATGSIRLSANLTGDQLQIQVSDDGRGIDWEKVRSKAQAKGLPHTSQADLIEAVFSDGLSTAESVTDLSGRGVGLSAVREACISRQGSVTVQSEPRQGTTFTFTFSLSKLKRFAEDVPPNSREQRELLGMTRHTEY